MPPPSINAEVCRALFESIDTPILIADWETARFVGMNRAALEQLGYTLSELGQLTGGDLSQLPREVHRRMSEELISLGRTEVPGMPIRRKDGSLIHMDTWAMKLIVNGAPYHVTILRKPRTDPGQRFHLEHSRLLESEAFYRSVVTCTEDAVVVTDFETGACIEANPAATQLFGYTAVQFQSVTREMLLALPSSKLLIRIDDELRATGRSRTTETMLRRRDGTTFAGDTMQNAFENHDRRMVVMIVRDVSEKRDQREQLERAQRLAAVGEVAAGVAHEINNPAAFVLMNADVVDEQLDALTAFIQGVERFADAEEDPLKKQALRAMASHAPDIAAMQALVRDNREGLERIRAVTRDLRLFSRMDERVVVEEDLNAAIHSALKLLRNELRHHARLTLDLADDLPTFSAQRGKFGQVATNLLLNAVQAITEGHAGANEIRVSTRWVEGEILFVVEDSGTGIDDETLTHIFEPFFTTKPHEQGTGLGLALCASIVAAHGGRMDVESSVGVGTKFIIRIPGDTGLTPTTPPSSEVAAHDVQIKRLLVIDDDPGMVRAYERMLRNHDATVTSSAAEALRILANDEQFDIIFCDLMMPELDGPQFHAALTESAPHLAKRIVFCTGGAFTARARDFVASVSNEVLEKPLNREDLVRLLGKA